MQRKHLNLRADRIALLQRCVAERLWIRFNRRWHGPYDWGLEYGGGWFGLDWTPTLADPYALISQARADIAAGKPLTFPSQSGPKAITTDPVPLERALIALEKFEKRVDAYYISGKDTLLLKSIESGFWHFQT